jgi:hypothetical protein
MKRIVIGLIIALASAQSANADVYVKVDAQGNALDGPIMCDAGTCGAGSEFSRLTLQPGERYVLQGVGVHYGIGGNNPNTAVKHEAATNEWVVSTTQPAPITQPSTPAPEPTVTVQRFTLITPEPTPVAQIPVQVPISDTTTVTTKTDTATVLTKVDTATVLTDTKTVTSILDEELDLTWDWEKIIAWIVAWFESIWIRL